jgi:outer membrane lipoprotein-sorting protein
MIRRRVKQTSYKGRGAGLALALLLSVGTAAANAQEIEPIEVEGPVDPEVQQLEAIESYLNSINSLKARFIQDGPDGKRVHGTFYLERPGRVRFEYEEEVPYLIVSDGKTLNLIDYDVGQITRWPIKDTPLALLVSDEIDLSRDVLLEEIAPGGLANFIAITARDPKKPAQGTLTLTFEQLVGPTGEASRLILRAWRVIDAQGGLTTVRLLENEANISMDPVLWSFKDPRGKRVGRRPRR